MTTATPSRWPDVLILVARILATLAIVRYGVAKFFDLSVFIDNPSTVGLMETFFGGAPAPVWSAYANAVFQTGAGLCVMVGFKARWAAGLLIIWLVGLTYFGHPFWEMVGAQRASNESFFLRNLAMVAALLMIVAVGAGRYSLDHLMSRDSGGHKAKRSASRQ